MKMRKLSQMLDECLEDLSNMDIDNLEQLIQQALEDLQKDFEQGFQGWEMKWNTVGSSRGDYPFISVSFGLSKTQFGKMANKAILKTRMNGQGNEVSKKPVLFPKLIFLYDENVHGEGKELGDVFDAAIECSKKAMYPDYVSLSGPNYVSAIYKKYGKTISPMGCRSFLSPWFEKGGMNPVDENDTPIYCGRGNCGVISLNLPMIYMKAKHENLDFYTVLDYYLELVRNLHKRTVEYFELSKKDEPERVPKFLWNAKMRFGKTFTSYQLAKEIFNGRGINYQTHFEV